MTFLDTNIILDAFDGRREHHERVLSILAAAQKGAISVCATTQSIVDAAYVRTQKDKVPVEAFRKAVTLLKSIVTVVSVTEADIESANKSNIPDYEDAVQLSCATRLGCRQIISRDGKYKGYTRIPVSSVDEFYNNLFE